MDPTTVIALLAISLLCSCGLFVAIGQRMPARQGLGLLAGGTGLFGVAYLFRVALGLPSVSGLGLVPDSMMVAATLFFIGGLRQLVGREAGTWPLFAVVLGAFVGIHVLAVASAGTWGRHVWLNLSLGVAYGVLATEAMHEARHGPAPLRLPLWVTAGLLGGLATLTLARAIWLAMTGTGTLFSGWPAQLYYAYASVAALLLSPCFLWMVFTKFNQQVLETSRRDTLTGVLNRSGLAEVVQRHFGTRPLRPLTLLQLDIDHFKGINDRYGHSVGDQVLHAVGRTLANAIRGGDFAARTGGEEFVVGCIDLHPLAARAMAERLREAVAQIAVPVAASLSNVSCTVSVGVSRLCEDVTGFDAAWREADQALYAAKDAGRDRVRMFSSLHVLPGTAMPAATMAATAPAPLRDADDDEIPTDPETGREAASAAHMPSAQPVLQRAAD